MLKRLMLTVVLAASPALASAQVTPAAGYTPPDDTQAVKVAAVIFYDYTFTKTPKTTDAAGNTISPSAFNVPRTYINVTGNISHNVAFRITPDVSRETGTGSSLSGSYTFRMKYGYAQFNLDDWTGNWKQTWVRVGIQQTPFIDGQESAYRYRFQGTVFAERRAPLAIGSVKTNVGHLEAAAVASGFYAPGSGSKLPTRWRRLFSRVPDLEREEVNILRGLLNALQDARSR